MRVLFRLLAAASVVLTVVAQPKYGVTGYMTQSPGWTTGGTFSHEGVQPKQTFQTGTDVYRVHNNIVQFGSQQAPRPAKPRRRGRRWRRRWRHYDGGRGRRLGPLTDWERQAKRRSEGGLGRSAPAGLPLISITIDRQSPPTDRTPVSRTRPPTDVPQSLREIANLAAPQDGNTLISGARSFQRLDALRLRKRNLLDTELSPDEELRVQSSRTTHSKQIAAEETTLAAFGNAIWPSGNAIWPSSNTEATMLAAPPAKAAAAPVDVNCPDAEHCEDHAGDLAVIDAPIEVSY